MSTEVYSPRMAVAVRRELRQANGAEFAQLLAYYKVRGGPGLALAKMEQTERQARHRSNHTLSSLITSVGIL